MSYLGASFPLLGARSAGQLACLSAFCVGWLCRLAHNVLSGVGDGPCKFLWEGVGHSNMSEQTGKFDSPTPDECQIRAFSVLCTTIICQQMFSVNITLFDDLCSQHTHAGEGQLSTFLLLSP